MVNIIKLSINTFLIFLLISISSLRVYSDEVEVVLKQLQEDIKTLEKAVYSDDLKH